MSLQTEHDSLVQKLQKLALSKSHRAILALQQRKLAVKLYIEKNGVKIIPMRRNKYRKNYIENVYVNSAFDAVSKSPNSGILDELKRIQSDRIAQKLKGVSI